MYSVLDPNEFEYLLIHKVNSKIMLKRFIVVSFLYAS